MYEGHQDEFDRYKMLVRQQNDTAQYAAESEDEEVASLYSLNPTCFPRRYSGVGMAVATGEHMGDTAACMEGDMAAGVTDDSWPYNWSCCHGPGGLRICTTQNGTIDSGRRQPRPMGARDVEELKHVHSDSSRRGFSWAILCNSRRWQRTSGSC